MFSLKIKEAATLKAPQPQITCINRIQEGVIKLRSHLPALPALIRSPAGAVLLQISLLLQPQRMKAHAARFRCGGDNPKPANLKLPTRRLLPTGWIVWDSSSNATRRRECDCIA